MSGDFVKLAVVVPVAEIKRVKRSEIAICVLRRTEPNRVIVRLTNGSTWVVTKASSDRAGLSGSVTALRQLIDKDPFPYSPRLKPFKSALAKFDPPRPKPAPKPEIAGASEAAIRRRKSRSRR